MRIQDPVRLPYRMIHHVQIRGGARMHNGAWDMMVMSAYLIWGQWAIIAVLCSIILGICLGIQL